MRKRILVGFLSLWLLSCAGQNVNQNVSVQVDNKEQNALLNKLVDRLATPTPGPSGATTSTNPSGSPEAQPSAQPSTSAFPASASPAVTPLPPGQTPTPSQAIKMIDCGSAQLAQQQPDNTALKSELAQYKRKAQEYTINRATQAQWEAAYAPIAQAFERADLKPVMQGCR